MGTSNKKPELHVYVGQNVIVLLFEELWQCYKGMDRTLQSKSLLRPFYIYLLVKKTVENMH